MNVRGVSEKNFVKLKPQIAGRRRRKRYHNNPDAR